MSHNVFYLFAHTKTRIENGEKLVIKTVEEAKKSELAPLYEALLKLNATSIYEVGYRMGATLLSIKRLLPTVKVSGAEKEDLNSSYSQQLFKTWDFNIHLEVRNFLDSLVDFVKQDVVYTVNLLAKYTLDQQKQILANMAEMAKKYIILVEAEVSKELVDYLVSLGWSLLTSGNGLYTFEKKVVPQKVESKDSK